MKKALILIFSLYILTLIQVSFLPHFSLKGYILNLVLISVILLNLFEKTDARLGEIAAFFGGFFLDVYSKGFFGCWILTLLAASLFIKYIIRKHVQPIIQLQGKTPFQRGY